jgi:phage shock protein A
MSQALTSLYDALMANEDRMREAVSRIPQQVDCYRTQKEVFEVAYTIAEAEGIREAMAAISRVLNTFGMATRRAQDRTTYMQARADAASDAPAPQRPDDVTSQPRVDIEDGLNRITVDIDAELARLKREAELARLTREAEHDGE